MTGKSESPEFWAFICYNSKNKKYAQWLYTHLESFVIPVKFRTDKLKENLKPVFLAPAVLSASPSLEDSLKDSLQSSRKLVLLCSPDSCKSAIVNLEVDHFKKVRGKEHIICHIIGGEPHSSDPEIECFPPALFDSEKDRINAAVKGPLGIDGRKGHDNRKICLLKLVASITEIPYPDLRKADRWRKMVTLLRNIFLQLAILSLLLVFFLYLLSTVYRQFAVTMMKEGQIQRSLEYARIASGINKTSLRSRIVYARAYNFSPLPRYYVIEEKSSYDGEILTGIRARILPIRDGNRYVESYQPPRRLETKNFQQQIINESSSENKKTRGNRQLPRLDSIFNISEISFPPRKIIINGPEYQLIEDTESSKVIKKRTFNEENVASNQSWVVSFDRSGLVFATCIGEGDGNSRFDIRSSFDGHLIQKFSIYTGNTPIKLAFSKDRSFLVVVIHEFTNLRDSRYLEIPNLVVLKLAQSLPLISGPVGSTNNRWIEDLAISSDKKIIHVETKKEKTRPFAMNGMNDSCVSTLWHLPTNKIFYTTEPSPEGSVVADSFFDSATGILSVLRVCSDGSGWWKEIITVHDGQTDILKSNIIEENVENLSFSEDGEIIVSAAGDFVSVRRNDTFELLDTFELFPYSALQDSVYFDTFHQLLAFSKKITRSDFPGRLEVFSISDQRTFILDGPYVDATEVLFSPSGKDCYIKNAQEVSLSRGGLLNAGNFRWNLLTNSVEVASQADIINSFQVSDQDDSNVAAEHPAVFTFDISSQYFGNEMAKRIAQLKKGIGVNVYRIKGYGFAKQGDIVIFPETEEYIVQSVDQKVLYYYPLMIKEFTQGM